MLLALYVGAMVMVPRIALADWSAAMDSNGNFSLGIGSDGALSGGGLNGNAYGMPNGSIFGIIQNILFWLLAILGAVAIIGFIIAGIMYLTAAGDETQAGKAKKAMMYSIIGVIVALSGFVVFQAAQYMLSGTIF